MTTRPPFSRLLLGASILGLCLGAGPLLAETVFTPTSDGFTGRVDASPAGEAPAIYAGNKVVISGQQLSPGQELTLMRGTTVLNADGPIVVDPEGAFTFEIDIDAEATTGLQPIVVIAENPAAATVVDMKISPEIAAQGADKFDINSAQVVRGLYQVAYDEARNAIFVTSSIGRPPVKESVLTKLDAETLEIAAQVTPEAAPPRADGSEGGVFAVYGVSVDDTNGNVWVTNTRQDTLAVYKADDLSLVRQFDPGTLSHSRDVVVDEANGRVYASGSFLDEIKVFDAKSLEELDPITIPSKQRRETFAAMSLDLDPEAGKLVTVSMSTSEAAIVDLASGEVEVIALPGAKGASGVAYDAQDGLIFVASQATDNLLIVDAESGEIRHDVEVGAQPLSVAFEPQSRLAYVANRASGTIAVVDTDGNIVANLEIGQRPNQLRADGKGNVFAVNMSEGAEGAGSVWRIRLK